MARPRKKTPEEEIANRLSPNVVDEISMITEMEKTGRYYFELPNGARISLASFDEYKQIKLIAQPYVDTAEDFPKDSWNDTAHLLTNCLNLSRLNESLTVIERQAAALGDPDERRNFLVTQSEIRSDITKQINQLQRLVIDQRLKLDEIRNQVKTQSGTLAEYLETLKDDAVNYCEDHLGEHQYLTTCPNPACRFYRSPFVVLQQAPHFAFDFAASPYIVWNQQIFELTAKKYRLKRDWTELDKTYEGNGLSFRDAARILRISPIGWLAAIYEKQLDGKIEFPIDLAEIINRPASLAKYVDPDNDLSELNNPTPAATL